MSFVVVEVAGTDASQLQNVPDGYVLLDSWDAEPHENGRGLPVKVRRLLFGEPGFHPNSIQQGETNLLEQLMNFSSQLERASGPVVLDEFMKEGGVRVEDIMYPPAEPGPADADSENLLDRLKPPAMKDNEGTDSIWNDDGEEK